MECQSLLWEKGRGGGQKKKKLFKKSSIDIYPACLALNNVFADRRGVGKSRGVRACWSAWYRFVNKINDEKRFCFFFFQTGQCAALLSFRIEKWYFSGKRVCFHESAINAVIRG